MIGCNSGVKNNSANSDSQNELKTETAEKNNTLDDIIKPSLIVFNGKLRFETTRDSLFALMNSSYDIKKSWEASTSYGSDNDTLEYITFQKEKIKYVYYNSTAVFVSMEFENTENFIEYEGKRVDSRTTLEEISSIFPKSFKNVRYNNETQEQRIQLILSENSDYSQYWLIIFKNNKIKNISYVVLD